MKKLGYVWKSRNSTPGGRALKFYAPGPFGVRGSTQIKGTGDQKIPMSIKGNQDQGRENKVAPPFKEAFIEIMCGEGISKTGELLKICNRISISSKKRGMVSLLGGKIGQGSENARENSRRDLPRNFDAIDHQVVFNMA